MKLFGKLKQRKAKRNITSYANTGESHLDFNLTSHCSPASPMVKNAPS